MKYFNYNTLKNIINDFVVSHEYEDLLMQYQIEKYITSLNNAYKKKSLDITGYKDGILIIKAASSTWRYELNLRQENLKKEINNKFGKNTVKSIIIN